MRNPYIIWGSLISRPVLCCLEFSKEQMYCMRYWHFHEFLKSLSTSRSTMQKIFRKNRRMLWMLSRLWTEKRDMCCCINEEHSKSSINISFESLMLPMGGSWMSEMFIQFLFWWQRNLQNDRSELPKFFLKRQEVYWMLPWLLAKLRQVNLPH